MVCFCRVGVCVRLWGLVDEMTEGFLVAAVYTYFRMTGSIELAWRLECRVVRQDCRTSQCDPNKICALPMYFFHVTSGRQRIRTKTTLRFPASRYTSCLEEFYSQLSLPTMNSPSLFSQPHSLVLGSRMQPVPTPELVPLPLQKKVQQSASVVKVVGTSQVYAEQVP